MRSYDFGRFKYAEEFAHDIDKDWPNRSWKMYRVQDEEYEEYEEDGETYTRPLYRERPTT